MTNNIPDNCIKAAYEYSSLEIKVKQLLIKISYPFCTECKACCCREDICSESFNSDWLRIIRSLYDERNSQYDDKKGWLSSYGCKLTAGRPPVCYEYFCDKIIEATPNEKYFRSLKSISKLPSFIGEKALGNSHLVTLSHNEIESRIKISRLRNRIQRGLDKFQEYERQFTRFASILKPGLTQRQQS
jgi:hypothetical protein